MSKPDLLPAPVVELPVPAENKWQREHRAFLRLLPELLKTHKGKYAAIHEEQCVDSDEDQITLALRVYARYGYIPIHVGLVAEEQPVVRIPSHRTFPRPVISSDWRG
ncbi:MAG: hypothetical protein HYS12_06640 [Planctomycetes bacterium]|nr:hypothetical protein [Planctomycetota bacterium]